jgi:hypothetical protein
MVKRVIGVHHVRHQRPPPRNQETSGQIAALSIGRFRCSGSLAEPPTGDPETGRSVSNSGREPPSTNIADCVLVALHVERIVLRARHIDIIEKSQ